jgi:hypothetical protein
MYNLPILRRSLPSKPQNKEAGIRDLPKECARCLSSLELATRENFAYTLPVHFFACRTNSITPSSSSDAPTAWDFKRGRIPFT